MTQLAKNAFVAAMLSAVFLLVMTFLAKAHSWYPIECCHDKDCAPHPTADVQESPDGYLLKSTNEFIARKGVRYSPDSRFHICRNEYTQKIICFFVPSNGS